MAEGEERGGANSKWIPAGVSSHHHFLCDEQCGEEGGGAVCMYEMEWMDAHNVSTRELHEAAARIQRC